MRNRKLHKKQIVYLFGILLLLFVFQSAYAKTMTLDEQFQAELTKLQKHYHFPGATAAYILPDGTTGIFTVGMSDLELKIPMKPNSRMLAASIGKTFVGATILALVNDSLLNLDDPISKWLDGEPWFISLPNNSTVTVRQLLNHTSGIPNHVEDDKFVQALRDTLLSSSNSIQPEELIKFVQNKPALFKAGEKWAYTDTGYLLLGLIIEKVTGNSYYQEVTYRFLDPLKLTLTTPSDRLELPGLVSGYMAEENIFGLPAKTTVSSGVMAWNPGIEWTGGGLVSNSKDLVVWAKALYEGKSINGEYIDNLLQSVPISEDETDIRYGTAVAIYLNTQFGSCYGHGGWIPGYSSSLRYYPEHKVAIAFQINTDIGIVDNSTTVIKDMENRLIELVINSIENKQ